jgi:hypothetical protein
MKDPKDPKDPNDIPPEAESPPPLIDLPPPPPEFRSGPEKFDPERCGELVKHGSRYQRPPSMATVRRYARDLRNGRWRWNAAPIRFDGVDEHGHPKMVDGFHRCMAVIEANVTVYFFCTYGISLEAMHTTDTGRTRSLAQQFYLNGVQAPKVAADIIKLLAVYRLNPKRGFSGPLSSDSEYHECLEANPGVRDIAKEYVRQLPKNLSDGLIGCAHYLFAEKDPVAAKSFCDAVVSGEHLAIGEPAYEFREWVISLDKKTERVSTAKIGNVLVDCWNKFAEGKRVTRIRIPRQCPEILSPQH